MYTRIKKSVRPRRKQDYSFPDGTKPERKQWIEGGVVRPDSRWIRNYWGRWDRARLGDEVAEWERRGLLIYTPRTYFKIELRHCTIIDGKRRPKTLKTWFIQKRDLEESWQELRNKISKDLAAFGLSYAAVSRIHKKIAKDIEAAVEGSGMNPGIRD